MIIHILMLINFTKFYINNIIINICIFLILYLNYIIIYNNIIAAFLFNLVS
jgi:hypothetical protein